MIALVLCAGAVPALVIAFSELNERTSQERLRDTLASGLSQAVLQAREGRAELATQLEREAIERAKTSFRTGFMQLNARLRELQANQTGVASDPEFARLILGASGADAGSAGRHAYEEQLVAFMIKSGAITVLALDDQDHEKARISTLVPKAGGGYLTRRNVHTDEGDGQWFYAMQAGLVTRTDYFDIHLDADYIEGLEADAPIAKPQNAIISGIALRRSHMGVLNPTTGKVVGYLVAIYPLALIEEYRRMMASEGGLVRITGPDGKAISAQARGAQRGGAALETPPLISASITFTDAEGVEGTMLAGRCDIDQAMLSERSDQIIASGIGEDEALAQVHSAWSQLGEERRLGERRQFWTLGLVLLATLSLAAAFARDISKRVQDLAEWASTVAAQGAKPSLGAPPRNWGRDEVAQLATAFEGMLSQLGERDAKLASHAASLEADVKDRTRDLAAERDRAKLSEARKERFLATVTHEMRTPLQGVIGLSHLIEGRVERDAKARELLGEQRSCGEHLAAIIDDLLDFAKLEAGAMSFEKIPLRLSELGAGPLGAIARQAQAKGLQWSFEVDAALPDQVLGDSTRLRQTLINLAGNALKFTEHGGITVRIERAPQTESDPRHELQEDALALRFSVADTSCGVPAEARERIFEDFGQASSSTARESGGTGLGLGITGRIVQQLGAAIELESTLGEGSEFSFIVRLEPCDEPALGSASHDSASRAGQAEEGEALEGIRRSAEASRAASARRILVVEDDATTRRVALSVLERAGHLASSVATRDEALVEAAHESFDLILIDFHLGAEDGPELAGTIRKRAGPSQHATIVGVTGNSDGEAHARGRAHGMAGILLKPYRPAELEALVHTYAPAGSGPAPTE